jgi:hypothetical protein
LDCFDVLILKTKKCLVKHFNRGFYKFWFFFKLSFWCFWIVLICWYQKKNLKIKKILF